MRLHFTRHDALAVRVKLPVHARVVKFIESHSQSFPTLHVATDQDQLTVILDDQVMLQLDMVNRLLLTGNHEPKSISVSIGIRFAYSELTALSPVFVPDRLVAVMPVAEIVALATHQIIQYRLDQSPPNQVVDDHRCGINDGTVELDAPEEIDGVVLSTLFICIPVVQLLQDTVAGANT